VTWSSLASLYKPQWSVWLSVSGMTRVRSLATNTAGPPLRTAVHSMPGPGGLLCPQPARKNGERTCRSPPSAADRLPGARRAAGRSNVNRFAQGGHGRFAHGLGQRRVGVDGRGHVVQRRLDGEAETDFGHELRRFGRQDVDAENFV